VRRHAAQKRSALDADHAKWQGTGARLARVMLALLAPLFGLCFGREWFIESGAALGAIRREILEAG